MEKRKGRRDEVLAVEGSIGDAAEAAGIIVILEYDGKIVTRARERPSSAYKGSIFKDLSSLDKIPSIPAHLPRTESTQTRGITLPKDERIRIRALARAR